MLTGNSMHIKLSEQKRRRVIEKNCPWDWVDQKVPIDNKFAASTHYFLSPLFGTSCPFVQFYRPFRTGFDFIFQRIQESFPHDRISSSFKIDVENFLLGFLLLPLVESGGHDRVWLDCKGENRARSQHSLALPPSRYQVGSVESIPCS
jgi:hypothetical protein